MVAQVGHQLPVEPRDESTRQAEVPVLCREVEHGLPGGVMGGDVALALQKELRDVLLAVPCRDVQGGVAPRAEEAEAGAVVQECHAGLAVPELRGQVQRSRREGLGVLPVDLEPVHVEQVGALGCLPRLCRPVQRVLGDQLKAGNEALDKPAAA